MIYNIAIDGPAGAGKSTIAKRVAKEFSFIYVKMAWKLKLPMPFLNLSRVLQFHKSAVLTRPSPGRDR